jgi:hypothetical protein
MGIKLVLRTSKYKGFQTSVKNYTLVRIICMKMFGNRLEQTLDRNRGETKVLN